MITKGALIHIRPLKLLGFRGHNDRGDQSKRRLTDDPTQLECISAQRALGGHSRIPATRTPKLDNLKQELSQFGRFATAFLGDPPERI